MTPETKAALEAFILQIVEAAKTGASWTAEQTPLLVQEWLTWQIAQYSMLSIIGLIVVLLCSIYHWKIRNELGDHPECVVTIIFTLFGGVVFIASIFNLVKVLVAPRVVVFEQFIKLIQ